jgi:zinc and cadmium transporter
VLREGEGEALYVLGGYLAVHLAQHVFTPHFHFGEETHRVSPSAGISALLGLTLHTFFDGVAIASGFGVGEALGLMVFTAILLHKIPEGVTVASIMLASGNSRRRALLAVCLLGVTTLAGVLLTERLGTLRTHGLALSAGVTLYVAASNLIPEVQKERSWTSAFALFAGFAVYLLAHFMFGGAE